jgi:hypothetical protein
MMGNEGRYKIFYRGSAFGDNLISAYFTVTLCDNGFDAVLYNPDISNLVDCPHTRNPLTRGWNTFECERHNRTGLETQNKYNVITDLIEEFRKKFHISRVIEVKRDYIPVKFVEYKNVPAYDVVIVSVTGYWSAYRNWPYFNELKKMLGTNGVDFMDLSEKNITGMLFLNYIKKAGVFVGLETGASHYASMFGNGKTLIIQSGYCDFEYWAGMYNFDHIQHDVDCSPCWLRSGCAFGHKCMREIKPEYVLEKIFEKLNR